MKSKIMIEQSKPIAGTELPVRDAEWFVFCMSRAGFALPVILDSTSVKVLTGMAAASSAPNPYDKILEHIKRYGSVRIWHEFGEETDNGVRPTIDLPMRESDT